MDSQDFVDRILHELEKQGGALTASEAARLACRSTSRVRHVFTTRTGMNFRTARLRTRLASAPDLLIHTEMSIPQIGAKLRYSDRSKFDKAFKRVYGVTPTQYRKQHA